MVERSERVLDLHGTGCRVGDVRIAGVDRDRRPDRLVPDVLDGPLRLVADYVVLGGGNTRLIEKLPKDVHRGANANAFRGGYRLWDNKPERYRRHGG